MWNFSKGNGVADTGAAMYEELEKAAATHNLHVVGTSARAAAATYHCLARTSMRSWTTSYWVQVVPRVWSTRLSKHTVSSMSINNKPKIFIIKV